MSNMPTIPLWVLLGFAGWTLLVLLGSVGVYRWSLILTGRAPISSFRADRVEGSDLYQRAMRAHANCVENLPVYAAIVLFITVARLDAPLLDRLAILLFGARIAQSLIHIGLRQTDPVVAIRFALFLAQLICMIWMGVWAALNAA